MADIDIDLLDRNLVLDKLPHINGLIINNKNEHVKHNTGVYLNSIPYNPLVGLPTIDYKEAEQLGYFKIDFINNSVYDGVKDREHLKRLAEAEPLWELLLAEDFVSLLTHIHSNYETVSVIRPNNIDELAIVLALIRPAKRHLLHQPMSVIERDIWTKPEEGYYFKKSHAYAYALTIIVQMNLIVEELVEIAKE